MLKLLERIWAGVVGAVAGACIGLVLTILLLMTGFSLDVALWAVAILALLGATVGAFVGNKHLGGK
jgi:hypothetical protein